MLDRLRDHTPLAFALLATSLLVLAFFLWRPRVRTPRGEPGAGVGPVNFMKGASGEGASGGDFARHVALLKKRLPSKEFTVVVEPPFVVVGDEPAHVVEAHARGTVRWAVTSLRREYFAKDPPAIIDIWLFKDAASYERHTRAVFRYRPETPYGYYSAAHRALVMNIATGEGTLVHEIVHPFIEANFPDCPPWLNEGLASLYEQSGDVDGRIRGFTNWRLAGLQQAVKLGFVPTFEKLTAMDADTFYRDGRGIYYGQARYLCYYLQEKGLLAEFYREFHARRAADPTGYRTLQKILGEEDMAAFQKRWEKYVLKLHEEFVLERVIPPDGR